MLKPATNQTQQQMLTEMRAMRQEQRRQADRQEQLDMQFAKSTRHTAQILKEQNVVGLPPVRT